MPSHVSALPASGRRAAQAFLVALAALSTTVTSCSSSKSAVGGGLLTDITGQASRRDTLGFPLVGPDAIPHASVSMALSHGAGERLLVGEANGLRASMLLKFAPLVAWGESYSYTFEGNTRLDTLTITPVGVATDSTSELRLTFEGFVTDSAAIVLAGWTTENTWNQDDSVTAALPPFRTSLFSSLSPDSMFIEDIFQMTIPPSELSVLISDSLSIAVQGQSGTPMHQYVSREGVASFSPQIVMWIKATVDSRRLDISPQDATHDTIVGLTLRPVLDTYRLERLVAPPSPGPNTIFLASGAVWRGFVRFDRFDIPGLSVDGVVPKETTVNSAILELVLDSLRYTFQQNAAHIEVYPLAEPFDFDKARNNELAVTQRAASGSGFSPLETRVDSLNVRRFQVADLMNTWWHDTTSNEGLMLNLNATSTLGIEVEEDRRVDAVEIVGVRLILTTTLPPIFVQKPTRAVVSDGKGVEEPR